LNWLTPDPMSVVQGVIAESPAKVTEGQKRRFFRSSLLYGGAVASIPPPVLPAGVGYSCQSRCTSAELAARQRRRQGRPYCTVKVKLIVWPFSPDGAALIVAV
jgi:hypothetical protein